jgi:hypothetical protein
MDAKTTRYKKVERYDPSFKTKTSGSKRKKTVNKDEANDGDDDDDDDNEDEKIIKVIKKVKVSSQEIQKMENTSSVKDATSNFVKSIAMPIKDKKFEIKNVYKYVMNMLQAELDTLTANEESSAILNEDSDKDVNMPKKKKKN